jgi:hypothetical protein
LRQSFAEQALLCQWQVALPQKSLSFTPGFSLVLAERIISETVETVFCFSLALITRLKPGVNERDFEAKPWQVKPRGT